MPRKPLTLYLAELFDAILIALQNANVQKTILIVIAAHIVGYVCVRVYNRRKY